MRIEKTVAIEALTAENANLDAQMASCVTQQETMQSTSCEEFGLSSAAYKAIDDRMQTRPLIISAHYLAYDSIKNS
ncbi:MAG: hypothetical protein FWE41_08030 [Coriobacteriia bacterium]|nr:hypothetical protein [Coriobacteriia bacterium]